MATTSVDAAVPRRAVERPLYVSGAIVAAIVVFAGFAPTYYLKTVFGAPDLDVLRHVHGLVMTTWFTLFFVQAWLASTGRIPLHRQLGAAGIVLAIVVLILGMQLGIASARAGRVPVPGLSPLVFLIFPVGEMVAFAILFGAAIGMRKRAAYHKRFMLLATLAMLNPAFARLPFEFVQKFGPPVFFGLTDLVILGCIAFDTIRNRRVHPAFLIGLAIVLVAQFGRLAIAQTSLWMGLAQWLVN